MPDPIVVGPPAQSLPVPPTDPPAPPAPPGPVPYDKDPALQEYIGRTLENRLQEVLGKMAASQPQPVTPDGDPLSAIAKEIAIEQDVDPKVAKSFVDKFVKINDLKSKALSDRLTQFELAVKFSQIFSQNPDAEAMQPTMNQVFGRMSELEKNFVLNSPDGAVYLYDRAKRETNKYVLPPGSKAAGGSPPSRTPPPDTKVGSNQGLFNKANELMSKGDRSGYEEVMRQITRR